MKEQELKNIWQHEARNPEIAITMDELVHSFKQELNTAHNRVKYRDAREIMVALALTVLFIALAFMAPLLLSKIACVLCALSFLYVINKLRQNREAVVVPKMTTSYRERLSGQHHFITKQMQLLNTVLYWYLVPILGSQLLFVWSLGNEGTYVPDGFMAEVLTTSLTHKLIMTAVFLILGYYVLRQNKKAVRINWAPLLAKIEILRSELQKP